MKKVWVLEGFITPEEIKEERDQLKAMVKANENSPENLKVATELYEAYEKRLNANPDGYWLGYQGKSNYRDFCYCAKQILRNLKGKTFRVVEAEIEDSAKYWLGYKITKENAGVLRYLMATL